MVRPVDGYLGEQEDEKLREYLREFYGRTIEKTGDLADYAERAGNRLQVLIST